MYESPCSIAFYVLVISDVVECNGVQQFVAGDVYTKGAYTWQEANDTCSKYNATLLSRLGSSHRITHNCWQKLLESVDSMKWSKSSKFWASACRKPGQSCGLFEANVNANTITFSLDFPAGSSEGFFFPICEKGTVVLLEVHMFLIEE